MAQDNFSTGSSVNLSYIKETEWGVTPTNGTRSELPYTTETLAGNQTSEQSDIVTKNRRVRDLLITGQAAGGDVNSELFYGGQDDLIEGGLWSQWDDVNETGDATINSSLNLVTDLEIPLGVTLTASGFTNDANNVNILFTGKTATGYTVITSTGKPLVAEAETEIQLQGTYIKDGNRCQPFTVEKHFSDVDKYLLYRGSVVSTLALDIPRSAKITLNAGFLCKQEESSETPLYQTPITPKPTNVVMTSGSNVPVVLIDNKDTGYARNITLNIDNALRGRDALGSVGNVSIGSGRFTLTGSTEIYFQNFDLYNKFTRNESASLTFELFDPEAGSRYGVYIPKFKLSAAPIQGAGNDEDVVINAEFTAIEDSVTDCTIAISRLNA